MRRRTGGGTPHKPPVLGPSGHVVHESTSCADYLMARGVRAEHILKETSSYDTVGGCAMCSIMQHCMPVTLFRLGGRLGRQGAAAGLLQRG